MSFSKDVEKDLSERIRILAEWGFALTWLEILTLVHVDENDLETQFKEEKPEKDCFKKFCNCN